MLRRLLIILILVVLGLPGLALADQICQVSETGSQPLAYTITDPGKTPANGGVETFTASVAVEVSFNTNLTLLVASPQNVPALLTLDLSTTSTAYGSHSYEEDGWSGTFSIIDTAPGSGLGSNLLSGTIGAVNSYVVGGALGYQLSFGDTTPPQNEITFTSDYLDFQNYFLNNPSGQFAAGITLTALQNALAIDVSDGFLATNYGSGPATFSATPLPPVVTAEPDTVVLVSGAALLGIGIVLRKRRFRPAL